MVKKNREEEIKKAILDLLETGVLRSISEITKQLEIDYKIRISPQITKRYLLRLEEEGKIVRKNG